MVWGRKTAYLSYLNLCPSCVPMQRQWLFPAQHQSRFQQRRFAWQRRRLLPKLCPWQCCIPQSCPDLWHFSGNRIVFLMFVVISYFVMCSLPFAAHLLSSCRPAGRQVCNLAKGRVKLKCLAHGNDSAVLRQVRRTTHETPRMIVRIMRHTENRKPPLKHVPRRDSRDILGLVKWPVLIRHNAES